VAVQVGQCVVIFVRLAAWRPLFGRVRDRLPPTIDIQEEDLGPLSVPEACHWSRVTALVLTGLGQDIGHDH